MTKEECIRDAQAAYMKADASGVRVDWEKYNALVHEVSWAAEINLDDAYDLVLNGPVIF
jgi:hypothetical protein